jgi:hypothetical protein
MPLFDPRTPRDAAPRRRVSPAGRVGPFGPADGAFDAVAHRPRPTGDAARLLLDPAMIVALATALYLHPTFDEVDPSEPDTSTFLYQLICRGVGIRANLYAGPDRRLPARIRGRMILQLSAYARVCADAVGGPPACYDTGEQHPLTAVAAQLDAAMRSRAT